MDSNILDIIIPCYNPLTDWHKKVYSSVQAIQKALPDVALYIYLVNDGSTQNINPTEIDFLRQHIPNFQFIEYEINKGKGYALREGAKVATHNIGIFTDIDFPYTLESFLGIYDALKNQKTDVAVGVRAETYYENVPKARIWISKSLKFFIRRFFRLPVNDTQCGLKGFNHKGKPIFLQTTINRYLFDLEFLYLVNKQKSLKLTPVHVELKPGIVFSTMNSKVLFHEGMNFLKLFFSWKR